MLVDKGSEEPVSMGLLPSSTANHAVRTCSSTRRASAKSCGVRSAHSGLEKAASSSLIAFCSSFSAAAASLSGLSAASACRRGAQQRTHQAAQRGTFQNISTIHWASPRANSIEVLFTLRGVGRRKVYRLRARYPYTLSSVRVCSL